MGANNSKNGGRAKIMQKLNRITTKSSAERKEKARLKANLNAGKFENMPKAAKIQEYQVNSNNSYSSNQTTDPNAKKPKRQEDQLAMECCEAINKQSVCHSAIMDTAEGHRCESQDYSTGICKNTHNNDAMDDGDKTYNKLISHDSGYDVLPFDSHSTFSESHDSQNVQDTIEGHTICDYEVLEQYKVGNVCVNIRTSVKSQCSMDRSATESSNESRCGFGQSAADNSDLCPDSFADDVFSELQDLEINEDIVFQDHAELLLNKNTSGQDMPTVEHDQNGMFELNTDTDSNEDSGIYDSVEQHIPSNCHGDDRTFSPNGYKYTPNASQNHKRTCSRSSRFSLKPSNSCPELYQLDYKYTEELSNEHVTSENGQPEVEWEYFSRTDTIEHNVDRNQESRGRCNIQNHDNLNDNQTDSDLSDEDEEQVLCDSGVSYHEVQSTLTTLYAKATVDCNLRTDQAFQNSTFGDQKQSDSMQCNKSSNLFESENKLQLTSDEFVNNSTIVNADQVKSGPADNCRDRFAKDSTSSCDVFAVTTRPISYSESNDTLENINNDVIVDQLECLLCGDEAGESHIEYNASKNDFVISDCGHVICRQCHDDYILTDPDAGTSPTSCPFCVT